LSPHEREVCRKSKAMASFFFDKIVGVWSLTGLALSSAPLRAKLSVVREIIGPISGRRTEILIAVNENAASMARRESVFVRCDNYSATG
jgi:hypothetical protein